MDGPNLSKAFSTRFPFPLEFEIFVLLRLPPLFMVSFVGVSSPSLGKSLGKSKNSSSSEKIE